MKGLKNKMSVLIQLLLMLCCMVATGEAKNFTLRDVANVDTVVKVDDSTSSLTGLNSFSVDGIERGFQQWFWYRVGSTDAEKSLDQLPKVSNQTSLNAPNLSITYTQAGQFDIAVLYELISYPFGDGKASLKKTVTISNTSGADLDYHFFEYSDYDLSDSGVTVGDNDNIEIHNNRVYQNGAQSDGSGITYTHESSLPPSSYDLDDGSMALRDFLNDADPTDFSSPLIPYGYASDRQFVKQWDLTIPAGQPVTFTITDSFYPTKPVTASVSNVPACVTYGGTTSYTINFDNLLNTAPPTESLTTVKLIDFLPRGITPANNPPTDSGVYDATANTVTWNLPNLAPGAVQQTKSLTVTVNSTTDFTNEILLVSDQAFPTRVPIQDPTQETIITNTLCNHPPSITDIKDASINEGSSFSVQAQAFPNDTGQTLTYSLNGAPAGMSISATGLISYPAAAGGNYTVTVTVTDNGAGALTASDSFILKVNKLPVLTSTAPTTASITQPYSYTISASDPDGDPLTYGLTVSPPGMTITGNVISWTPALNQAGSWPVRAYVNDGKSGVSQDFTINVSSVIKQTPTITWAVPAAITYGTALSATQLNASTSVPGSFAYTPASGTILNAGNQNLSVVFTPTDTTNYNIATATITLTVNKATPTITWATPAAVYVGSILSATQLNATANVNGSFVYTPAAGTTMNTAGNQTLSVTFSPTDTANYTSATASVVLAVNSKITPTISWATPAAITYGTALSATQLNAAVSGGVAGSLSYSPALGTVLNAGSQTLSVTFTPTNTTTYNSATATVTLTVNKAAATVALSGLSATYDGTAKAVIATTNPAGKTVAINYNGSSTAPTAAGSYAVVATISDANYSGNANGTLTIAKATPVITWATPAAVYIGTSLSATQLNATANVNGSFVYTPAAGTTMNTAGNQTLSVTFSPTDTANYTSATASVVLAVNSKITPTISWATPAAITYGTALSASQLNAAVSGGVAGSFSYSPALGTVLNAGSQTLSATFTPTNTTTYNSATATVTLTVNKAAATVALSGLTATYDGTAKAATATTNPAGKTVAITYAGNATAPSAAGSYAVVATVNDANYSGSASGTLVIVKATPVITWAAPAAISVGTALTSSQLNATASVPGSFVYSPAAGSLLPVGSNTLSVAFSPTDAANYTGASTTVSITVNSKQTPTISWATPAAITYGTALSASQLNAAVSDGVAGSFSYSPALGTVLNAGSQTLSVTFTPTNTTTYNSATATVTLTVNKAAATVALSGLSATYDGTAKAVIATTNPAGKTVAITYAGNATAPSAAGSYAVVATVNDANYSGSASGTLVIAKATPTITWAAPVAITYGTPLSATQLNASASMAGSFAYTPAAGTVPNVGTHTLNVVFTPNDAVNYNTVNANVALTVAPVTPAILPDGDVSGDGKVDISDALLALKISIGLLPSTAFNLSHADVGPLRNFKPTPDGKIDIEDVIVLLLRAVGTIPAW